MKEYLQNLFWLLSRGFEFPLLGSQVLIIRGDAHLQLWLKSIEAGGVQYLWKSAHTHKGDIQKRGWLGLVLITSALRTSFSSCLSTQVLLGKLSLAFSNPHGHYHGTLSPCALSNLTDTSANLSWQPAATVQPLH